MAYQSNEMLQQGTKVNGININVQESEKDTAASGLGKTHNFISLVYWYENT